MAGTSRQNPISVTLLLPGADSIDGVARKFDAITKNCAYRIIHIDVHRRSIEIGSDHLNFVQNRLQGHHNDGGGRPVNGLQQQGHAYYSPDVDYDGRQQQPNFSSRRPQNVPRRYRRRRAATSGSVKLLGNNRFRNVTNGRTGNSQTKASILDQMDAVSFSCKRNVVLGRTNGPISLVLVWQTIFKKTNFE